MQSLWIGPRLGMIERLTIESYLQNGHRFVLFTYEDVESIPRGAEQADATQILPASRIFRYRGNGSLAGFSNFFRYKMLLEKGGWWVDLDTVCLKPFDMAGDYVFSSEIANGREVIDCAAIKAPANSPFAQLAWEVCDAKDPEQIGWGETGPRLTATAIEKCRLFAYVLPPSAFCPVPWDAWETVLDPAGLTVPGESYAIHLWNEMWRRAGRDKDAAYPSTCFFERLKSRYLGS